MGQKVHPYGFRLGIIRDTRSKWFAEGREYRDQLVEDLQARKTIHERHHHAGISSILIERAAGTTTVTIESAKPGIIIGRGGSDVDRLRRDLDSFMSGRVRVNVEETKNPEQNAQLIAEEIAGQIERRASIRRAMSQAMDRAVRVGVEGIRVAVSGRLMGAEIARTERMGPIGSVPLHTLRADVERGFSEAVTGYGHIGVQVFVCNGVILPPPPSPPEGQKQEAAEEPEAIEAVDAEDVVTGEVEQVEAGEEPAHQPVESAAIEQDSRPHSVHAPRSAPAAHGGIVPLTRTHGGSSARTVEEANEEPVEETEGGADTAEMDELLAQSDSEEAATVSASTQQAEAPVETEAATEPPEPAPVEEAEEAEQVEEAEEAGSAGSADETEISAEEDAGDVDA